MDSSIVRDFDRQMRCFQETLNLSNNLREKLISLENEKDEAVKKCKLLETKIFRLEKQKCLNCAILLKKLNKERSERERQKKEEKAKLLKAIVKTLEEDGATNQMSNAQQLLTELVFDGLDSSRDKRKINLIVDELSSDEDSQKVFADETVITVESEDSSIDSKQNVPVVIPETEIQGTSKNSVSKFLSRPDGYKSNLKENIILDTESKIQQLAKRPKCEQVLTLINVKNNVMTKPPSSSTNMHPENVLPNKQNEKIPLVLINEPINESRTVIEPEEQSTIWKMKPSFIVDNTIGASSNKRLKQMTLSVSRPEKKNDISLSGKFKGGLAHNPSLSSDDEKDVVLPSPNSEHKTFFSKKNDTSEVLEDPDLTIFQPNAASTCLPVETSFDKIPVEVESPPFKYRRDTVRKKEKRMKLPGQNCDECEKYYKAAGLDKTQDLKTRMNACSRHRDKYELRAHTPPGFWDPVFPVTPEESQEGS